MNRHAENPKIIRNFEAERSGRSNKVEPASWRNLWLELNLKPKNLVVITSQQDQPENKHRSRKSCRLMMEITCPDWAIKEEVMLYTVLRNRDS